MKNTIIFNLNIICNYALKCILVLFFCICQITIAHTQIKLIVIDEGKPVNPSARPKVPPVPIPASFDLLVTNQDVGGYFSIEYTLAKDKETKISRVYNLDPNDILKLYGLNSVIKWLYISPDKRCTYVNDHTFKNPEKNQKVIDTLLIAVTHSDLIMCRENVRIYDAITSKDQYVKMPYHHKDNETIFDFEVSKYEVSVEQYILFVNQTDYKPKANKFETKHINPKNGGETADKYALDYRYGPNGEKRNIAIGHVDRLQPVIYVNKEDISAFLKWINDRDKTYEYKLPSKNEWEYLAMGKSEKTNKYPWGNNTKITDQHANTCDASLKDLRMIDQRRINIDVNDGAMWTWSVNTGVPNEQGIYNVIGNVAEWTDTSLESDKKIENVNKEIKYIFKGGSYFSNINDISVWATESAFEESMRHPGIGFRLVRSKRSGMK